MKGKTHSTEEIIRILRQADGGETAQSVCREHNISEQTVISDCRLHYNQERPHSRLGYRSPNEFINTKTLTS